MMSSSEETNSCLDSPHATVPVMATATEDIEPDYVRRLQNLQQHDSDLDREMLSTSSKWRYEQKPYACTGLLH